MFVRKMYCCNCSKRTRESTICAVLVVLWLLGYIGGFGGVLIHLLLVAAVIMFVVNFLGRRRTV